MSIPIDSAGMQQHLAMVQRQFAALAAAKKEMVEKPKPSPSVEQNFSKMDPQAARGNPSQVTPPGAGATGVLPPDGRISQQGAHATIADTTRFAHLKPVQVDPGPNHFELSLEGPDPDFAVGGTHDQQEHQRDVCVKLTVGATVSYASRALPAFMRTPPDSALSSTLDQLNPNPPIGTDGKEVTHAVYQSQIPNATPQQVFDHWVQNPNDVFNAGGMEIRPQTAALENGGRYMLEIGKPPTWLPVKMSTNPEARSITIQTLDGHVLRGTQTFSFQDDGKGGTRIVQDARFQAGAKLVGDAQQFLSISRGQHEAWQSAHRESYEQFNGNPGYAGQGIPFDPVGEAVAIGGELIGNVRADPGGSLNAGIDLGGDLANLGADVVGKVLGGQRGHRLDRAGDLVEGALDRVGDMAEDGVKALGRVLDIGAKATDVVERNGFGFLREKAGEGLGAVIGDNPLGRLIDKLPFKVSDDPIDSLMDKLPFKNSAHAAIQTLPPFSRDKITLNDDSIDLIKQDPAFIAHQGEVVAAIKTDPRYGQESFSVPLSELPVEEYVELGGKRGAGDMKDQLLHAWDVTDPDIRATWKVAGNDLSWLLRHAKVDGTAHVDKSGNVKIDYQVTDKLDLRPNGSSGAYDKVTEIMGTVWHDLLGAKESLISGSFSTETKAG